MKPDAVLVFSAKFATENVANSPRKHPLNGVLKGKINKAGKCSKHNPASNHQTKVTRMTATTILICKADDCGRSAMYKGKQLCQKHYFRLFRTGGLELLPAVVPKEIIETPNGYLTVHAPGHPVGNGRPRVFQHRVVMYEKCGDGPFHCALCTKHVTWKTLHVDHINENKRDNDPENLRITCRACNTTRTPRSTTPRYEYKGRTLSLTEWAAEPGVTVGSSQLRARIAAGWPMERVLFEPNKTHARTRALKKD